MPYDPTYAGRPGDDPRSRQFRRPLVTTIILIMLVIMIVLDILSRRRGVGQS
jgi:hypothetical protein